MNETAEALFDAYLEGVGRTELNETLLKVSAKLENKAAASAVTCADLAEYEEAAAHAAFYAGLYAAMKLFCNGMIPVSTPAPLPRL